MQSITIPFHLISDLFAEGVRAQHEGSLPKEVTFISDGEKVGYSFTV